MFSPPVAKAIAFVVAAAVFIGLMTLAAVGAGFLSEWGGQQIKDWPPLAIVLAIVGFVVGGQLLARHLIRRDQRNADRANR